MIRKFLVFFFNFSLISNIILIPTQKVYIVKLAAMSAYGVVVLELTDFDGLF